MLRFGLLVLFWVLFFLIVLAVEALLLSATQRDPRRAPATREHGRFAEWWSALALWWRRFFIVVTAGLALIYALLLGATVTQALAGDLGKFWAVIVGFGISGWIAVSLALLRLDDDGARHITEDDAAIE